MSQGPGGHFVDVGEADERAIKRLMADWRRGRADRSLWEALSSSYTALFSVAVLGAMLISAIVDVQQKASVCDTEGCISARSLLPWASVAGVLTVTIAASRMFGPVLASAAEGFWLLDSPMDRRRLLAGRMFLALALAGVLAGAVAALVAALTGQGLAETAIWAASGGLGAAGLTALAALEQTYERRGVVVALQWSFGLASMGTLGVLVANAAGWLSVAPTLEQQLALIVGSVGLALLVACSVAAYARLREIRRQRLTSGGALLSGLQGAAFALELPLIRDILVEYRCRERGHVRPTRGAGSGANALVLRDVQRLGRNPLNLVVLAATVVVPYSVEALGLQALNVTISAVVLMAVLVPFMNTLRVLSRSKGLERLFPFSPATTRKAAMVVPAVLAGLWSAATIAAFVGASTLAADPVAPIITAAIAGLGGFLGAVRWVSAKPANYSGPLVATGAGAMPPGMMFSMMRGFDVIALVTLPLLFGLPAWVSVLIGVVAFVVLSTGMDREALLAQQEEQQRLLQEAKAERSKPKKRIQVQRRR